MRLEDIPAKTLDAAVKQVGLNQQSSLSRLGVEKLLACEYLRVLSLRTLYGSELTISDADEARWFGIVLGSIIVGIEIGLVLAQPEGEAG